jgi:hypothetical protein
MPAQLGGAGLIKPHRIPDMQRSFLLFIFPRITGRQVKQIEPVQKVTLTEMPFFH